MAPVPITATGPGRLFSYVVRNDTGLAPNPFWGWCTLAVCTPNHQGSKVAVGDWIAGFLDKRHGYRFLYAMEVSERLHMDAYFHDRRFARKKPRIGGTTIQRCGDNFYSQDGDATWRQHANLYHATTAQHRQDTKRPWVFAGQRFWYLGGDSRVMPSHFAPLAGGRGARVNHDPELVEAFKAWVRAEVAPGMTAFPRDIERPGCKPPAKSPRRGTCLEIC